MLSLKQKRFAEEYALDFNATKAARRAGYSEHTAKVQGSRLLTNVNIKNEIDKNRHKIAKKNGLTHEWVIKNLKKVYKRCMQSTPVMDSQGNPTGEYKFEHAGATKSLELIGKHLGTFTERVKLSNDEGQTFQVGLNVAERIKDILGK